MMALVEGDEMVIIDAEGGGRGEDDMAGPAERRDCSLGPTGARFAVDCAVAMAKRAAGHKLLVDKHNRSAGACRQTCSGETRRPGTDDQHIAVMIDLVRRPGLRPGRID